MNSGVFMDFESSYASVLGLVCGPTSDYLFFGLLQNAISRYRIFARHFSLGRDGVSSGCGTRTFHTHKTNGVGKENLDTWTSVQQGRKDGCLNFCGVVSCNLVEKTAAQYDDHCTKHTTTDESNSGCNIMT
ncbi:hypothetical protein OUZ56_013870 [Daphnia magna]|uniref:Uncharacterized protein n=1 Tax=Daphnia magna TaxID=35525 RepID=A0ABQ9Z760_9CRUS|nr:hypothetical protein OUZ56_013870 [Daphnia magna]